MKHTIQNEAFELVQQAEQAQPGLKSPGISPPGISPGFGCKITEIEYNQSGKVTRF